MNRPPLPSDRSFGTVFIVFFALLAIYAWWKGAVWFRWPLLAAGLTGAVTLVRPGLLRPLNRLWMKLAELLNQIVSPLVMAVIFYGLFTPIAWVMRATGRDTMKRRFEEDLPSYWIERRPPGPDPKSLPNQF